MADPFNEGFKPILDHANVKNRATVSAWEQRLWQCQRRNKFIDPRDEHGRRGALVGGLLWLAQTIYANNRES